MKTFQSGARLCAALLTLSLCFSLSAQTAPAPLPQPELSALPVAQQSALRELRAEFDRNIASLKGEDRAVAFLQMGALYLRSGLTDAGNIALDHAVAAQPSDPRFVYLRGVAAMRQERANEAAAAFAQTIRLDPNYLPAHYHLAEIQIAQDNLAAARSTVAAVLAKRRDLAPALALLGEIALRERRYDESITQFNAALKIEPAASALRGRLAEAYAGRGDSTAAARERALVGDVTPRIVDPLALQLDGPGAQSATTNANANPDPVAAARTQLEARVRAAPRDLEARLALIEILALSGDLAGARTQLQAAQSQSAGSANVLLAQAIVAEAAGDDAGARAALQRAVTADPAHSGAQRRYADNLMRGRQPDIAYRHYLAAAGKADEAEALASAVVAASLANRCGEVLPVLRAAAAKRSNDGRLAQIEVRAIASCPIATAAQKAQALKIAKALYAQRASGELAEALAMSLAANSRAREAVDYEAQAIFDATKRGDSASLAGRRAWLQQFERGQPVSRPWPEGNLMFAPPALRAVR